MSIWLNKCFFVSVIIAFFFLFNLIGEAEVRDEGIIAKAPLEEYTGSKACATCHSDKYKKWLKRFKASFVQYRRDYPGQLPGDWGDIPYKKDDRKVNKNDILIIVGKRRKVAFVDKNWRVIPFEYFLEEREWNRRGGWARNEYDYRERCAPCHTVGSKPNASKFKELNVGCESCHGPGKIHVETPNTRNIKAPGRADDYDVLYTCRRCHNDRGRHADALEEFTGTFHK